MTGDIATPPPPLLGAADPAPVQVVNGGAVSPFLLIGDHAGNAVPQALAGLGIAADELGRHIGIDIGIAALGPLLAERLDAPFVRQTYSRLVVDCNRAPDRADAICAVSDETPVPANAGLSDAARAQRFAAIHEPYQQAIADALARLDAGLAEPAILVSLHSFTPRMRTGEPRPWQAGVLHDRGDTRFTHAVLAELRALPGLTVGDNEPYRMDAIDHTVPRHAYPSDRLYVELEVRQDLLATPEGCEEWSALLAGVLVRARERLAA